MVRLFVCLFVRRLSGAGLGGWDISLIRMGVGLLAIGLYLTLFRRDRFRIRLEGVGAWRLHSLVREVYGGSEQ